MNKRHFIFILIVGVLALTCNKDKHERLFEMVFQPIDFQIPAGLNYSFPIVFEFNPTQSNIDFYLNQNSLDKEAIGGINPAFGSITSLDGVKLDFIDFASVLVCAKEEDDCIDIDEVFYTENLFGGEKNKIKMLPTLRNVKHLLTEENFRLEVVLKFNQFTPAATTVRLDMSYDVTK